jgi:hypothetical protein
LPGFFGFSIFILSIQPAGAKRFSEDWLILSENWGLIPASGTLLFVGWVEPISGYVGFRFTQLNLHFVSSIVQCETQQWLILEPIPKNEHRTFKVSAIKKFPVYPDLAPYIPIV